ncbi:MAG TPA: phage terminase large subunit [Aggregatilinea sp.]|uniref:phage terminase large subunit n=1 Tax=Aggregatilinea sp. TaxID=2806333 RepID=UPI002D01B4D9|nr:phage terminase large subunit [Aggregatilinea sp.]HML21823.1 phage terminase large subunit [Aggregatilinea sp.]
MQEVSKTELLDGVQVELARRKLIHFTTYTYPRYVVDPAHELIAATLDRVVSGEIKKLMIFAPPQHGKSELTSVRLPAYWLGKRPNDPVLMTSYGADLAEFHGGQARDVVMSEEYKHVFPDIEVRKTSRSTKLWRLDDDNLGYMLSAGVGGPITGRGGLLGIIDDPFATWQAAQSPTIRQSVWEWWRGTFRTRVWEGGSIVLIMTRWHEDDLAGRLLQEQGDEWTILRLPALAETQEERDESNRILGLPAGLPDPLGRKPGEALCPRRFSREALLKIKRDVGTVAWNAEYQGVPRAPEGNKFKRAWFDVVGASPKRAAKRVRYWDKAGTEDGGAYTTGTLMSLSPDETIYIEDVVRGQWSALEREKTIKETAELDALKYGSKAAVQIYVEEEPGSGGKESADATVRNLRGFVIRKDKPSGDKLVRAEPFAAYSEAKMVKLVRGLWNTVWLDEITAVPNNKYWDQLDSASGAFNKLAKRTKTKAGSVTRRRPGT